MHYYLHLTHESTDEPRRIQVLTYTPEPAPALSPDYSAILVLPGNLDHEYASSLLGQQYTGDEVGVVELTESALQQKLLAPTEPAPA
jgi:hypothetical protein